MEADEARPALFPSKLPPYCPRQSSFLALSPHPPTAVTSSLVTGTISQQHSTPSHYFQTSTTPPSRGALRPMCGCALRPPVHFELVRLSVTSYSEHW